MIFNRSFPSYLFASVSKKKSFAWKCVPPTGSFSCKSVIFICNGGLVLKPRHSVTRKRPLGETSLISLKWLFTFFLINIQFCVEKVSHQTRIDYKHLKNLWNLVVGKMFGCLGVTLEVKLASKKLQNFWASKACFQTRVFQKSSLNSLGKLIEGRLGWAVHSWSICPRQRKSKGGLGTGVGGGEACARNPVKSSVLR